MISKPALVTAYRVLNGKEGEVATGKYYGYPDAPYTLAAGETVEPQIYPAITAGIAYESYASNATAIATFSATGIEGIAAGETTLTATLQENDDATGFTILNPMENGFFTISFNVIVGENLDDLFASGQNYGTYYNTSTTTYKVPEGIKAYIVTGVDGDKVTVAETKVIPPNTPVLLEKGNNATTFTHTAATDADGNLPSGNLLKYASSQVAVPENGKLYVLYKGEFVKATAGSVIDLKCYLDLSSVNFARGFYEIDTSGEGTTAILSPSHSEGEGAWFDLQGRRIQKPTKTGLYIVNGKKMVVNNK